MSTRGPSRETAQRRRRREHNPGFWVYLAVEHRARAALHPATPVVGAALLPAGVARQRGAAGADFTHFTFSNYQAVFGVDHIFTNLLNSFIVALGTALITMAVATLAGYGLAKFRFRGSGIVFGVILLALMIPFQAVLTPCSSS